MKRCVKCGSIIWPWQRALHYVGDKTQPQLIPGLHHADCTVYIFEANRKWRVIDVNLHPCTYPNMTGAQC